MKDNHSFGLDMIRALAIILVIICHIGTGIDTKIALFFGYFGVELFFVLSGFLIGGLLIRIVNKEDDLNIKDIKGFWKSRWFRTLPSYYLVLIVFLILDLCLSIFYKTKIFSLLDFVKYFTFTQNLIWLQPVALHTFTSGFFALSWTLAIEEWFYLLFPLTLLICSTIIKNKKKVLLVSAGIFILFFTLLRIIISIINPNLIWTLYQQSVLFRLDAIAIGVLGVIIYKYYPQIFDKYKWISFIISSILLLFLIPHYFVINISGNSSFFSKTIYFNFVNIAIILFFPAIICINSFKIKLIDKYITYTSKISYSIYLLHIVVITFFLKILNIYSLRLILTIIAIYIVATIFYKLYEKPMTDLREKGRQS